MKISTLHKIAREINAALGRREVRTVNQMTADLNAYAGDARSKREAAYLIMTEVFDLIDDPDWDRARIDGILNQFTGEFHPAREVETA